MTAAALYEQLRHTLGGIYPADEAAAIAMRLTEQYADIPFNALQQHKEKLVTEEARRLSAAALNKLLQHEPLQYVLGEAWFYDLPFYVNSSVLIPRPETEELVFEAINWIKEKQSAGTAIKLLDIGTGSGCIPVSIKYQLSDVEVSSIDLSASALEIAGKNATRHNTSIELIQQDFLDESLWPTLPVYDIIISNPPYIPANEKEKLDKHVADWEPGLALFVPDNDALLFYRKIMDFAKEHLQQDGIIFLECHYEYAIQTQQMFEEARYKTLLKKDMQGNNRMLIATK